MSGKDGKKLEDIRPSIDLAYEYVRPSYEWLQSRLDAANNRLQYIVTLASTITVAAIVLGKAIFTDISYSSVWIWLTLVTFVLIAAVAMIGRMLSGMKLTTPKKLFEDWLGLPELEFKKDAVYFAGQHFEYNSALVSKKGRFADVATGCLLLEIAFVATWMIVSG